MTQHALHGPSTLDALDKCIRFQYGDFDDDAASEGTEMHAAAQNESTAGLTPSQRKDVQICLDFVNSIKASEGGPEMWRDIKEARVELKDLTHGTADRLLIHKVEPIMHCLDWKFTRVESDHEHQIETYGAAAYDMFGDLRVWRVHLHVVEPRIPDIKSYTWSGEVLLGAVQGRITALYARIENPWLPETPHPDTCPKCARALICPSMKATATQAIIRCGLPMPGSLIINEAATIEQRAQAQAVAGALENIAQTIKKSNLDFVKATGAELPGFKKVTRSTGARIAKERTPIAIEQLVENGIDRDIVLQSCSLTLGDLSDKWSDCMGITKQEAKEQIMDALGDLVSEGETTFLQRSKRISDAQLLEELS